MNLRDGRKFSRRSLMMAAFPALSPSEPASSPSAVRYYTATATVTFLGVALVTRNAAASGFARFEEIDGTTILEFGAGSHPERCAGLNRLGYIRELAWAGDEGRPGFRTFGFLSSSKEESLQEARRALQGAAELQFYTILDSSGDQAGGQSAVAAIPCRASLQWPDWPAVEAELLKRWPAAQKRVSRLDGERRGFLSAVRAAMRKGGSGRVDYSHNDKAYLFEWSTRSVSAGLSEMNGQITGASLESRSRSKFRLWYDASRAGDPPVSFEYQPRTFLRVRFENVPMTSVPGLARSFRQPSATAFVTREKP